MAYSLSWMPRALLDAGLKVSEVPGWATRGRGDVGTIRGVMCHHTATSDKVRGNMPTLDLLITGRLGQHALPGPLAQLGLGRDGTYYVIAAGRANHAGAGEWEVVTAGNTSFIGIEAEHCGAADSAWPHVQLDAYHRGVAALLTKIGADAIMCCGHKEYAQPHGRKCDPCFDMELFRHAVAGYMAGGAPAPQIPAHDPGGRPTVRRGMRGPMVAQVQVLIGIKSDGVFGAMTEAAAREAQRRLGITPDGIVGPKTWQALTRAKTGTPA